MISSYLFTTTLKHLVATQLMYFYSQPSPNYFCEGNCSVYLPIETYLLVCQCLTSCRFITLGKLKFPHMANLKLFWNLQSKYSHSLMQIIWSLHLMAIIPHQAPLPSFKIHQQTYSIPTIKIVQKVTDVFGVPCR